MVVQRRPKTSSPANDEMPLREPINKHAEAVLCDGRAGIKLQGWHLPSHAASEMLDIQPSRPRGEVGLRKDNGGRRPQRPPPMTAAQAYDTLVRVAVPTVGEFIQRRRFLLIALALVGLWATSIFPSSFDGDLFPPPPLSATDADAVRADGGRSPATSKAGGALAGSSSTTQAPNCSLEEYDDGAWSLREGGIFETLADMKVEYDMHPGPASYGWSDEQAEKTFSKELINTMVKAASYKWQPRSGCSLIPWDREAFITRIVKSFGGLWMIGDSVNQQHYQMMKILLLRDDEKGLFYDKNWSLHINASHPEAKHVFARAGVPASRAKWPLITAIRNDRLIAGWYLRKVYKELEIPNMHLFDGDEGEWWSGLCEVVKAHKAHPDELMFDNTVFMFNTGAHWARSLMNISVSENLLAGYNATAHIILNKLKLLDDHLDYYYRATYAAHIGCNRFTEPQPSMDSLEVVTSPDPNIDERRIRFAWDLYPAYNEIYRSLARKEKENGGKLRMFDTWRLTNQRPDSHLNPIIGDCMHSGGPTIPVHWTYLLWHTIQGGAEPPRTLGEKSDDVV